MKINKSNFGWIFTCVILVVLLGVSLYLGASGWFFKYENTYTSDLVLGKTVTTSISKNQSTAVSMTFDGSFLPGERLPQIIGIKNAESDTGLYLRAKTYVYTGDNITIGMDIVETINWTFNQDDGYYYYNGLLQPNADTSLCSHVIVSMGNVFSGHKKYILTISFESLSENQSPVDIWEYNPSSNI